MVKTMARGSAAHRLRHPNLRVISGGRRCPPSKIEVAGRRRAAALARAAIAVLVAPLFILAGLFVSEAWVQVRYLPFVVRLLSMSAGLMIVGAALGVRTMWNPGRTKLRLVEMAARGQAPLSKSSGRLPTGLRPA